MGLTDNPKSVWLLFIAISAHKYVISFCISMQFVTSGLPPLLSIIYFSTFALISPVGAGIGILISETVKSEAETQTVAVTVLQGLATGTLLYVVFFEVIEKERLKGTTGMVQVMLLYWETTPSQEHNHAGHLCLAGLRLHARHGGGGTLFRGGAGPSNTLLRVRPSHLQQHLQASFNHMFARESHNIT